MIGLDPTTLIVLGMAVLVAGTVRGFSGFGDALIFMPIGAFFIPPVGLMLTYMLVASSGPIPLLPQAWATVDRRRLAWLNIPMLIAVPVGFWITRQIEPEHFRLFTASLAVIVAILMIAGWKPRIAASYRNLALVGGVAGFIGGISGVPGAILVFFILNMSLRIPQIRAAITLTLFIYALAIVACVIGFGEFNFAYIGLSLFLIPIYVMGGLIGKRLFSPDKEHFFRAIALASILASGLLGMPYELLAEWI